jgi:integrase
MTDTSISKEIVPKKIPWNKSRFTGPKPPLKAKQVWSIRTRLQVAKRTRDLALFDLAIDSKLRGCDLVRLKIPDIALHGVVQTRATVTQRKTGRPVQFEITEQARASVHAWLQKLGDHSTQYLFPSRVEPSGHLSTRQYARLVDRWTSLIGLDPSVYGTHSLRRTKASLIYKRTGNLRAVQLLLGHSKLDYVPHRTMSRCAVTRLIINANGEAAGT